MTDHGYVRYSTGCRCDVCRSAKAEYMRNARHAAREAMRGAMVAPGTRHGIAGYQNHRCRCRECVAAKSAADKRQYAARRPTVKPPLTSPGAEHHPGATVDAVTDGAAS